ncbi:MAG: carboxypeptidase regulatory-like domain-containing protein [Lewinellaceae bacterium]|nr:carboxypeptidase regulatory-like domain-containing protein [Lewinellaceae bacterium]
MRASCFLFIINATQTSCNFQKIFVLLLAFAAAFATGCRKDKISDSEVVIPPDPTIVIATGVFGLVTDESGTPIEAATVYLGNKQIQTDENGYFSLDGFANQVQPFVKVEKAGYLPSLASFSTKAGDKGRVKVTLRAKTLTAQVDASTGGAANLPGGGSIQFEANGFVDAAGQAYNGSVMVYATYLDPSQPQTESMVPASWQGRSATGEAQVLLSYGMIHALLETPAGQKLQISKPAQITVPVPADRLSNAPSEIPLWYIDEVTSLWKEEGSAVLQGAVYKGSVSHFELVELRRRLPGGKIIGYPAHR